MRTSLYLILISLAGALIWAGICAAFAVPQHLRFKRGCTGYTGKEARRTVRGFVIFGLVVQAAYWVLAVCALEAVSYNRYREANEKARSVYETVLDYHTSHPDAALPAGVMHKDGIYPEDSPEAAVQRLLAYDREDEYFAVIVGADGKPETAYWSYHPLDAGTMQGTTRNQAKRIVLNPLVDDNRIVGEYSPQK